jgi:hypothetical protein
MAKLTITEAIKRSPVGKSQFYAKYVEEGLITISVDNSGKKFVESSELLRCFGEMKSISSDSSSDSSPLDSKKDNSGVNSDSQLEIIKLLKDQLAKAEDREEKHLAHISSLTLRLEAPASIEPGPRKRSNIFSRWWYGLDKDLP